MSVTTSEIHRTSKTARPVIRLSRENWSVLSLLTVSAFMYVWNIDRNGWGNSYYAAAVQAGQHDLKALIFGAADWGNAITVDKPPLSLWVMGLSVWMFGLNPWAMLLPQAAMTLISTVLVYKTVKLAFSDRIALLSASVFALTPITVLLARYNNPDPLMVLLMLAGLYIGLRGIMGGKVYFVYLASFLLALGFLAKQLQAFLVIPAIVIALVAYSEMAWRKRLAVIAGAGVLLITISLSWPLFVDLTPSDSRPYVGGSRTNSLLELTLGYNGLERVIQQEDSPSTALIPEELRRVATDAGLFRLFNANYGQEIGWLLLPGMMASVAILATLLRGGYDTKKSIIACTSVTWFLTTFLVLSFMGNNFHSYYTASLAAPLALCIGLGTEIMFSVSGSTLSRMVIAASIVASIIFSRAMWQLSESYPEWLGTALSLIGLSASAMLCVPAPKPWITRLPKLLAVSVLLVGPIFCSTITMASPQEGSNPLSGGLTKNPDTLSRFLDGVKHQKPAWAAGVAIGAEPSPVLAEVLRDAPEGCIWPAATYPGQTAARFQLEVGRPVMALGGFAAVDPSPTFEQFQEWVSSSQVCFLVEQPEQLAVPGNSEELKAIQEWASNNFRAEKIDGVTVYRLTS